MSDAPPLLQAEGLVKTFALRDAASTRSRLKAVDGVSLRVDRGRTLAVVGESGCGKSTLGDLILRLQEPDEGHILLEGEDLRGLSPGEMRRVRQRMQVIFQDPYSSLDPRERIGDALMRPMRLHGLADHTGARRRAGDLLERVGLAPHHLDRLPHQFSGGQRQRIAIARALSVEPDLIVCDEPVSALDVSVQAQIVNLLQHLQRHTGVAFLFISHDLAVVRHLAHDVAVMYAGRFVETAPADRLFDAPRHPYTQALLAAAPRLDGGGDKALIVGEPPDLGRAQQGCSFAGRCPFVRPVCREGPPPLAVIAPGHASACLFAAELPPTTARSLSLDATPAARRIAAYRRARDRIATSDAS